MGIQSFGVVAGDIGTVPTCKTCGSERVVRDAWACFNPASGLWELETVFDQEFCHKCESETGFVWMAVEAVPRLRIRELNDRFRSEGLGNGSVFVTAGIRANGHDFLLRAVAAVRTFSDFSKDNDPWGEHDFGSIDVGNQKVFWKFDYYSPDLSSGSENPANDGQTHRVLTIMLASEY